MRAPVGEALEGREALRCGFWKLGNWGLLDGFKGKVSRPLGAGLGIMVMNLCFLARLASGAVSRCMAGFNSRVHTTQGPDGMDVDHVVETKRQGKRGGWTLEADRQGMALETIRFGDGRFRT